MARLRFWTLILVAWLIILFNIERPDFLNIDLHTAVYVVSALSAIAMLTLPRNIARRWPYLLVGTVLLYGIGYFVLTDESNSSNYATFLITEMVMLGISTALALWVTLSVSTAEEVMDRLLFDDGRILSMAEGEAVINNELFRARQYDRPLSIMRIKTPSLEELHIDGIEQSEYQLVLQHRFLKTRIGLVTDSMIYQSLTVAWYNDDIVVCLPETNLEEGERLARQVYKVIYSSVQIPVPIGIAEFPDDGLIYRDLVISAAHNWRIYDDDDYDNFLPSENGGGREKMLEELRMLSVEQKYQEHKELQQQQRAREAKDSRRIPAFNRELFSPSRLISLLTAQSIWSSSALLDSLDLGRSSLWQFADESRAKPYYRPDFWVNRIGYQRPNSKLVYMRVKRAFDIAVVLLASPLVLPIAGLVALAVYLEDGAPVFYSQRRTGLGGHEFRMIKFRSMVRNADQRLKELGVTVNERKETIAADGSKLKNDPRVTRVGRIIRKTSLDELPQLWNVLMGHMSIVGPRPTSFGVDKYTLMHTQRLSVRPGITGLWQVYDRGDTDFDNRLVWDIKYIEKMCLWLDVQIMLRTVTRVLKGSGA